MPSYIDQLLQGIDTSKPVRNTTDPRAAASRAAIGLKSGQGLASSSGLERDYQELTPLQFDNKYGDKAAAYSKAFEDAKNRLAAQKDIKTSFGQDVKDGSAAIAQGFNTGTLGTVAAATGLVSDQGGAALSNTSQTINDYLQGTKSAGSVASNEAYAAQQKLGERDNQQNRERKVAQGESPLLAGFGKVLADAGSSLQGLGDNPGAIFDTTAQGLGSFASGGVISGALKGATKGVLKLALKEGKQLSKDAASKLVRSQAVAGQAGQEIGGTYVQTTQQVLNTPIEQLKEKSIRFNQLADKYQQQGYDEKNADDKARKELASEAGGKAAAYYALPALLAAGISTLPGSKFEGKAIPEIIKEPFSEATEELFQGITGQAAQNKAIQDLVDPDQDITEGIGEQAAQGAVAGFATAGAIRSPRIAGKLAVNSPKVAGLGLKKLGKSLLKAATEEAPLSDKKTEAAANFFTNPENDIIIEDEGLSTYVSNLQNSVTDTDNQGLSEYGAAALKETGNRIKAAVKVAKKLNNSLSDKQKLILANDIETLTSSIEANIDEKIDTSSLENGSVESDYVNNLQNLLSNIDKNQSVKEAIENINKIANKKNNPVTRGTADLEETTTVLARNPLAGNVQQITSILAHNKDGKFPLTPKQQTILEGAKALLEQKAKLQEQIEASGTTTNSSKVADQILSGTVDIEQSKGKSALQHFKDITTLASKGDSNSQQQAQTELNKFTNFVTHMSNKVAALNESLRIFNETGEAKPVSFLAYNAEEDTFFPTTATTAPNKAQNQTVRPSTTGSVKYAQTVAQELQALTTVYNALANSLPNLDIDEIDNTELDKSLLGDPKEVAANFAKNSNAEPVVGSAKPPRKPKEAKPKVGIDPNSNLEPKITATENKDGSYTVTSKGYIVNSDGIITTYTTTDNNIPAKSSEEAIENVRKNLLEQRETELQRDLDRVEAVRKERPELLAALERGIEGQKQVIKALQVASKVTPEAVTPEVTTQELSPEQVELKSKLQKFVTAWSKKFGFKSPTIKFFSETEEGEIKNKTKNGFYRPETNTIYLNDEKVASLLNNKNVDANTKLAAFELLAQQLGHAIDVNILENLSDKDKNTIDKEFKKWLKTVEDSSIYDTLKARLTPGRFTLFNNKVSSGEADPNDINENYAKAKAEWLADQIARYVINDELTTDSDKFNDILKAVSGKIFEFLKNLAKQFNIDIDPNENLKDILESIRKDLHKENKTFTTYDSGFTALNLEQQVALDLLIPFVNGDNPKTDNKFQNVFVLTGKAGTGKTTIMQQALYDVVKKGKTVALAAIAHAAKDVLGNKVKDFLKENNIPYKSVEAYTIAKLTKQVYNPRTGKVELDPNYFRESPYFRSNVIVIDEASMIDEKTVALLIQNLPPNTKIIFLGDKGQLSPIRDEADLRKNPELRDQISPILQEEKLEADQIQRAHLLERVRQGEESSILPYADYYWNNSTGPSEDLQPNPIPADARVDSKELNFIESTKEAIEKSIELFKKAVKEGKPNLIRVLGYNNKSRNTAGGNLIAQLEDTIRTAVFGENKNEYENGEIIIFNDSYKLPNSPSDDPEIITNNTQFTVTKVSKLHESSPIIFQKKKYSYDAYTLTIHNPVSGQTYTVETLTLEARKQFTKDIKKFKSIASQTRGLFPQVFELEGQFAPLGYAYAITAHKAQGSTYQNVVVLENNIMQGNLSAVEKSRAMYTAITRASDHVTIVGSAGKQPAAKTGTIEQQGEDSITVIGLEEVPSEFQGGAVDPEGAPTVDEDGNVLSSTPPTQSQEQASTATPVVEPIKTHQQVAEETDVLQPYAPKEFTEQETKDLEEQAKELKATTAIEKITEILSKAKYPLQLLFPNLNNIELNRFKTAFKLNIKNGKLVSKLLETTKTPIDYIRSFLSDEAGEYSFLNNEPTLDDLDIVTSYNKKGINLSENEKERLKSLTGIRRILEARLNSKFGDISKGLRDITSKLTLQSNKELRPFYISELGQNENGDETIQYNQKLIESAILAGVQWLISNYNTYNNYGDEDLKGLLGKNFETISKADIFLLNSSINSGEAKQGLARVIKQFWGLSNNPNEFQGYTQGIPESIAAEVLSAFSDLGLIEQNSIETSNENEKINIVKITNNLTTTPQQRRQIVKLRKEGQQLPKELDNLLHFNDSSFIEDSVLNETRKDFHYGDELPPNSSTILKEGNIELTDEQASAAKNESETPSYLNTNFIKFVYALGLDKLTNALGGNTGNTSNFHENYIESIKGKNTNIQYGFNTISKIINQLKQVLATSPEYGSIDKIAIRNGYGVSKVLRMQMQGSYNAQGNKTLREAYTPVQTTLDLTAKDGIQRNNFFLTLAQSFGIKTENSSVEDVVKNIKAELESKLPNATNIVRQWLTANQNTDLEAPTQFTEEQVKTILEELESFDEIETRMFTALIDYARYKEAQDNPEQLKEFQSNIYFEADGKANGPTMAMLNYSTNEFTQEQLDVLERGGISFFEGKPLYKLDKIDIYSEVANNLENTASEFIQSILNSKTTEDTKGLVNDVLLLLSDAIPDFNFNTDNQGNIEISRGLLKNPLTILHYGSVDTSIATKIASSILDEYYKRVSNGTVTENFTILVNNLVNFNIQDKRFDKNSKNDYQTTRVKNYRQVLNEKNYFFNSEQLNTLGNNIFNVFVTAMSSTITSTIGPNVFESLTAVRKVGGIHSAIYAEAFKKAVEDKILEKTQEAKDKGIKYNRSESLSQKDFKDIFESLSDIAPILRTGRQNLLISKNKNNTKSGSISAGLFGEYAQATNERTPSYAGVAAMPYLVIGTGDSLMMQILANDGSIQNTLKIFDGINIPVDKIQEYSEKANAAIYELSQENNYNALDQMFNNITNEAGSKLVSDLLDAEYSKLKGDIKNISEEVPLLHNLTWTLTDNPPKTVKQLLTKKEIIEGINALNQNLKNLSRSKDARTYAMKKAGLSVDQMAGASANSVSENAGELVGLTLEEKVSKLNEYYNEYLNDNTVGEANNVKHRSFTEIVRELYKSKLSKNDKRLLKDIIKANNPLIGQYNYITGTTEEIRKYVRDNNIPNINPDEISETSIDGFIDTLGKNIYLVTNSAGLVSPETILHETIHAGTYETILNFYNNTEEFNKLTSAQQRAITEAINSTESLMNQILESTDSGLQDIQNKIAFYQGSTAQEKAIQLNEFMAWGLSNPEFVNKLKQTRIPHKSVSDFLISLVQDLFNAGLTSFRKTKNESSLDSLRFNTNVLLTFPVTTSTLFNQATLNHAKNTTAPETEITRLKNIRRVFKKALLDKIPESDVEKELQNNGLTKQIGTIANYVNDAFHLNALERSTFQSILAALMAESSLDTNTLTEMGNLYSEVLDRLTVDDLMPENSQYPDQDRFYANNKFNILIGNHLNVTDKLGRSSIFPVFVALAMTSKEVRDVLDKLQVDEKKLPRNTSVNQAANNLGSRMLDSLGRRLSNKPKSGSVLYILDSMVSNLKKQIYKESSAFERALNKPNQVLDAANNLIIKQANKLTKQGEPKTPDEIRQQSTAKNFTSILKRIINTEDGDVVGESLLSLMNRMNLYKPLYDLINDVIGTTDYKKDLYKLIKPIKSGIQSIRQDYIDGIPAAIKGKFNQELTEEDSGLLFRALAETDIGSLLGTFKIDELVKLFNNNTAIDNEIQTRLDSLSVSNKAELEQKMKDLALYMTRKEVAPGLLRNAAIMQKRYGGDVKVIDELVSLYAIRNTNGTDSINIEDLYNNNNEGVNYVASYLKGLRNTEAEKSTNKAKYNAIKGYVPSTSTNNKRVIVAPDSDYIELRKKGYIKVGDYKAVLAKGTKPKGLSYYVAATDLQTSQVQGIMQNIRLQANSVDPFSGKSNSPYIGNVVPLRVARTEGGLNNEQLIPLFDENGEIEKYQQSYNPDIVKQAELSQNLPELMGKWRGRQLEEELAQGVNKVLVDKLYTLYRDDIQGDPSNQEQYIDLFNTKSLDPVTKQAITLMTPQTRKHIQKTFGNNFYVRKDVLDNVIGYPMASLGDAWSGVSRWPDSFQKAFRETAIAIMGYDAYKRARNAEKFLQGVASSARDIIITKSGVVTLANTLANIKTLMSLGIPVTYIAKNAHKKIHETELFVESHFKQIRLEADLLAETNVVRQNQIKSKIQLLEDSKRRMSIWPLIEAGEFSTITDVGLTPDDLNLVKGNFTDYIDEKIDKLPTYLKEAARHGVLSRRTSLYKAMQKSVYYSDFVSKAILYDYYTETGQATSEEAIHMGGTVFITYEILGGRGRDFLESIGLAWFLTYKIRSIAASLLILKKKPLTALLLSSAPALGLIDTPLNTNLISSAVKGTLDFSIGPEMGINSLGMLPVTSIFTD